MEHPLSVEGKTRDHHGLTDRYPFLFYKQARVIQGGTIKSYYFLNFSKLQPS
jgi:hypothetical protein